MFIRIFFILFFIIISPLLEAHAYKDEIIKISEARAQGRIAQADSLAELLLDKIQASNEYAAIADTLYQLGRNAMERNDYAPALDAFNTALTHYQDLNDQSNLALTYRQIGLVYRYQVDYENALKHLYYSMEITKTLNDVQALSDINNSLGVVYERLGDLSSAAEYHQISMDLDYQIGDQGGIATALYNLGDIRRIMGDLTLAKQYFTEALVIDTALGEPKYIAYSTYKLGLTQMQLGEFEAAQKHINAAYEIFNEIQAKRDSDWALSGKVLIAIATEDFDDSEAVIQGIIERSQANAYLSLLADAHRIYAQLLMKLERWQEAQLQMQLAIEQARQNNEQNRLGFFYSIQMEIAEKIGNYNIAYEMLKAQKDLQDELLNKSRLASLTRVQAQTEFIRRENQIKLLEKEAELQVARIDKQETQRWYLLSTLLGTSLLIFLAYTRFMQKRLNRKLSAQVSARTKALKASNQKLEALNRQLQELSITDNLTGLKNRHFFADKIHHDLHQVMRFYQDKNTIPNNSDLCLFAVDIDKFKSINDQYGHNVGDEVLVVMAKLLQNIFRESDYLVRWGGEEFIAVAREVSRKEASLIAERIRKQMENLRFKLDQHELKLSVSIGFVCYPLDPTSPRIIEANRLVNIADRCLYSAKENGRNTWFGITHLPDNYGQSIPQGLQSLKNDAATYAIQLESPAKSS